MFLSTGSTLFNLALSDKANGGFSLGKVVNLIGDSSAGKTLIALTCLAEASIDSNFNEYELILDDAEAALEFDIEHLFGKKLNERIVIHSFDEEQKASETLHDVYRKILNLIKDNKKFIYILDSLDALTTNEEKERGETIANDKKVSGSYSLEKQKTMPEVLRNIVREVEKTDSLVIIISQTRDNIGFGAQFTPKVRSGGRALKFFCSYEVWLSVKGTEKSCDRVIGHLVNAKVTKNKYNGKIRDVSFPVYYSYGLDDISSCVQLLIDEKVWPKSGKSVDAVEFGLKHTFNKLISVIEETNRQPELIALVEKIWNDIEDKITLDRTAKYI